jgi:hypothetical protein
MNMTLFWKVTSSTLVDMYNGSLLRRCMWDERMLTSEAGKYRRRDALKKLGTFQ